MSFVLKNCRIIKNGRVVETDIEIENGKIIKVAKGLHADEERDAKRNIVLPGLIDSHVHFRYPGHEYKETWETGSRAAAKGGVTTVLDMPNNAPSCKTLSILEMKRKKASKDSIIDFGFHFGAAPDNFDEIKNAENIASVKVYMGSTTGTLLLDDDGKLLELFQILSSKDIIATVHAVNDQLMNHFVKIAKSIAEADPSIHCFIRQNICVAEPASRAAILAKHAGARLHITHMSTRQELEVVKLAKQNGSPVTCDVTPHHLFFNSDKMRTLKNFAKMNPCLKSEADRQAMWYGLKAGLIDIVATDHAPHTIEEKERDYWYAPSGVPGVEYRLPLMLDAVNKGIIDLALLQKVCCENPARIYRINNKGKIEPGYDADLVVIDMNMERTITKDDIVSKCGWSPYEGMTLRGWPIQTYLRGKLIYDNGEFYHAEGREVSYSRGV